MRWGTITGTSPLRVRLDGDTDPLPFTPDSLVDPLILEVNDRVRCEISGRVVIVGKAGGGIFDAIYPVGSIYLSVNPTNPGTLFGGTWEAWGSGRVPVGVDAGQSEFDTVEKTGGAKTHTLSASEMPAHTHSHGNDLRWGSGSVNFQAGSQVLAYAGAGSGNFVGSNGDTTTSSAGSGAAHNNLQPYITCFMWKRTA